MRDLVLGYYFVVRTVLRRRPDLRPCLTRCRHCRIFFLTHPRNRGRGDLGCPFGCRDAHRAKRSAERSRAYYGTPAGKKKKARLNGKRRQTAAPRRAPPEASEMAEPRDPEEASAAAAPGGEPEKEGAKADPGTQPEGAEPESAEIAFDAGMVEHVRLVTSLIEGREVSREEVLEMLRRTLRQHRIARESEIDQAVRRLLEEPP